MERFSKFTLIGGKTVYIDTNKITAVKDISENDKEGRTVIYAVLECGLNTFIVRDSVDSIMYSIDTKENPDFYKEPTEEKAAINPETKIGSVTLKDVLIQIRNVCKQIKDCQYCPFCEFDGHICNCVFHETYPEHWEIEEMQGSKQE